ncbi:MAG: ArsB/NhaD family transporter [Kosmotoga sp.]|uniref:ArsB/NhaD family transporter n=1 Tax=Kosmotoga sp. TaxID=1955248 RepID=UPI001D888FBF|nr:ArsB/NhaD family transporter [Kosmotoga sp.]MBO8165709.1 ArsB/NhaD family transporter [Kosmotoga sp.]
MERLFVIVVFLITYYLIIRGKLKRSIVAFSAGMLIVMARVIEDFKTSNVGTYVDFNTIGLLIGMMIVVAILRGTGFFEYVAIGVVKLSRGNLCLLFGSFIAVTALFSAFLDNVTTILLFSPILFLISDSLDLNPSPLIFSLVLAANFGGTATMIGDPPNILIGSASGEGFLSFIYQLAPIVIVVLLFYGIFFNKKYISNIEVQKSKLKHLMNLDMSKIITSKKELVKSISVFLAVIIAFILHEQLDYEAATIALTGAAAAMLLSGRDFSELAGDIEWDTIFFFIGLFMLSYGLKAVGITDLVSNVIARAYTNEILLYTLVLWLTAIVGGFIGAVPVVTVMIPIIKTLIAVHGVPADIWWVLSIGACFGGSATMTGAAANMVGTALLERHTRKATGFREYLRFAFFPTVMSLIMGNIYIIVRYGRW